MPRTDEEWARVRNAALTVAEAGNLLMMPTRARDNEEWMVMSRAMIDGGEAAAKAAVAKDPKAIVAVGDQIYQSCDACHKKYIVVPPGGYGQPGQEILVRRITPESTTFPVLDIV